VRSAALVIATVALALAARLPSLGQPLLEEHGFRQTWTAYTALVYRDAGIDLLHPQLPVFGPPFLHPQEFPLFQAFAALLMDAGVAPDLAMRLTALGCFAATAGALFGLVRYVSGVRAAAIAVLFFVATPFGLVWSRASLIEYLATAGTVAYLWMGIRYRDDRSWRSFAFALAAGVVGVLVKPTTGVFGAIPLALYRSCRDRRGWRAWLRDRRDPRLVVLGLAPTALAIAWTAMADVYFRGKLATQFLAPSNLRDYFLDLTIGRGNADAWGLIAHEFAFSVVGLPFLLVLAVGMVVAWRGHARAFWAGMGLAVALAVLIFYGGYRRHDYYQAAISPQIAAFIGVGGAWLLARTLSYRRWAAVTLGVAAIGSLGLVYLMEADRWQRIYVPVADPEGALAPARELAALSRPDDLVVMIGRGWDPDVLYYARRQGLLLTYENGTPQLYRTLPSQGYRVFFSLDPAHDATDIMRWWTWNGAVGPRTYEIGADPRALARSAILSTDDATAFDAAASRGRPLAGAPSAIACDGHGVTVPVDPSGTWLLTSAPAGTIVSLDLLEGPLPIRRVFVLTPQSMYGRSTITASCYGPGSLSIERVVAAPPPAR